MSGHFQSRDKDVSHTIQSAIATNPTLHANFTALYFTELELLPIATPYIARTEIFDLFCSCDIHLYLMKFIYELDQYSLDIYWMCKYELPMLRLSKIIDRHTDRKKDRQTWLK